MKRKYLYKHIICFQYYGTWNADCVYEGKRFALHRACCATKANAYEEAKAQIDCLNERSAR